MAAGRGRLSASPVPVNKKGTVKAIVPPDESKLKVILVDTSHVFSIPGAFMEVQYVQIRKLSGDKVQFTILTMHGP